MDVVNLSADTSIPVEMERFWASSKNKHNLQLLSRNHFIEKAKQNKEITVVLSGYVSDASGIESGILIKHGVEFEKEELKSSLDEADYRIIQHIAYARKNGYKRIVVASNDTDVVIYALSYFVSFDIEELWVRFGTGKHTRNIPIHLIFKELGTNISSVIIKAHILTGCDLTSKVGTKAAALKAFPERFLKDFGEGNLTDATFQNAERYLVTVVKHNTKCETFDELRYNQYITKNATLTDLAPTSRSIRGHIMRSYYLVRLCLNLLDPQKHTLQPTDYGWYEHSGMLLPEKYRCLLPERYTVTCACHKGCHGGCGCRRKTELCTDYCSCQKEKDCNNKH